MWSGFALYYLFDWWGWIVMFGTCLEEVEGFRLKWIAKERLFYNQVERRKCRSRLVVKLEKDDTRLRTNHCTWIFRGMWRT